MTSIPKNTGSENRRVLLHTCCAPCAIYPVSVLQGQGFAVTAYFYNPNIHPYLEYQKRLDSVVQFCEKNKLPLIQEGHYQMAEFLRAVVFQEHLRCSICSSLRISKAHDFAKNNNFAYFTTSLLYSRYQKHDEIKDQCEALVEQTGPQFYYKDFRQGWQFGVDESLTQGLYRQPYCGCIYSEQQRYDKTMRSKRNKAHVENDSPGNK